MKRVVISIAAAVVCQVLFAVSAHRLPAQETPRPLRINFVHTGGGSRFSNEQYQDNRRNNFKGHQLEFIHTGGKTLTKVEFLDIIKNSDIFFYSGHSGEPSAHPGTQVLCHNVATELVLADEIRGALQGKGPPLVIINGCETTADDGVPEEKRISGAFGIADKPERTKGRAYLGWPKLIPGVLADDQIGRLLTAWTKPDESGVYMTIDKAREKVGIDNLTIIGDLDLRYKTAFQMRMENTAPATKDTAVRLLLGLPGAKSASVTFEFGEQNKPLLQQFGLPEKLELVADRDGDRLVVRDPKFAKFVEQIVIGLGAAAGGSVTADVREATISIRPEDEKIRATVKIDAETTLQLPNEAPRHERTQTEMDWIGTPEAAPPT